jgi:hypothetical protein
MNVHSASKGLILCQLDTKAKLTTPIHKYYLGHLTGRAEDNTLQTNKKISHTQGCQLDLNLSPAS